MRLKKRTPPLQALHEICIKSGWRLPFYIVKKDEFNQFKYGMKLNDYMFTTSKTAQQKKLAQAELAKVFLQWLRVLDVP